MLWLCFATNLSLSLDPVEKTSQVMPDASNNKNNNKENNQSNMKNRVMAMKSQVPDEEKNWINSNLSKTSQLTSIEVEEMKHKLKQARKDLRSINKELRESYANYDYLEVRLLQTLKHTTSIPNPLIPRPCH